MLCVLLTQFIMPSTKFKFLWLLASGLFVFSAAVADSKVPAKSVTIVMSPTAHVRVKYGEEKLAAALKTYGYAVKIAQSQTGATGNVIVVGTLADPLVKKAITTWGINSKKE